MSLYLEVGFLPRSEYRVEWDESRQGWIILVKDEDETLGW